MKTTITLLLALSFFSLNAISQVLEEATEILSVDEIEWNIDEEVLDFDDLDEWTEPMTEEEAEFFYEESEAYYDEEIDDDYNYGSDFFPSSNDVYAHIKKLDQIKIGSIGPGTLSKDGLSYFVPLDIDNDERLYVMTRSSIAGEFTTPVLVEGAFSDLELRDHQPSLSLDNNIMVFVRSKTDTWGANQLFIATKNMDGVYDDIRSLDELNRDNTTDAYPWLSPDGLTLYWTSNHESKGDWIFSAERSSVNDKFGPAEALEMDYSGSVLACWLSNDELNIYFSDRGDIQVASRSSKNESFGTPHLYMNADVGFVGAPAFTQDLSQLFVYSSQSSNAVVQFKNDLIVAEVETEDVIIIKVPEVKEQIIYPLEVTPAELTETLEIIEPTESIEVKTDLEVPSNDWISKGYPNPTEGQFTVELKLPASFEKGELVFFSLDGKELKSVALSSNVQTVEFNHSDLPAGTYIYYVRNNESVSTPLRMVLTH